ncbi:MAG: hypothetical protein U0470_07515 [Anaerolineae bacterium]
MLAERLGTPVDALFFLEDGAAGGGANVDGGDPAGHRTGDHER